MLSISFLMKYFSRVSPAKDVISGEIYTPSAIDLGMIFKSDFPGLPEPLQFFFAAIKFYLASDFTPP